MDAAAASELAVFENYCETLYNSPSADERAKAEAALVQLSTTPEYIPRCQFVLSSSSRPYAQLVASNALKRLLVSNWNHLAPPQRLEYRNYTLNVLASQVTTRRLRVYMISYERARSHACARRRCPSRGRGRDTVREHAGTDGPSELAA